MRGPAPAGVRLLDETMAQQLRHETTSREAPQRRYRHRQSTDAVLFSRDPLSQRPEVRRHSAPAIPVTERECAICFDKGHPLDFYECPLCGKCVCWGCLRLYIEFRVLDGRVSPEQLVCPEVPCSLSIPENLIQRLSSAEIWAKYKTFQKNQAPGIRFCPRPGCGEILQEPKFSHHRRGKCASCEQESCMRCGGAFHTWPICHRTDKRLAQWRDRHNARMCPNCRSTIEKTGGCRHMTCSRCSYQFCWWCLQAWTSHHETLCMPLSVVHSQTLWFVVSVPVRVVTKTVGVGVAAGAFVVVLIAGVGLASVAAPPLIAYNYVSSKIQEHRHSQDGEEEDESDDDEEVFFTIASPKPITSPPVPAKARAW